ncbi:Hypothetical predicted protein, partial [Paramuricea clavata]
QQFTDVNDVYSSSQTVKYGVPQGSLLGPRLFKIYVDDLPDNVSEGWVYMFADDTTGYDIGDNIDVATDKLNQMTGKIYEWCRENKITAHIGKTEAMILSQQPFYGPVKPICFGDEQIKLVTTT